MYPFQDYKLSREERIQDLISRMTPEEKASQLLHDAPAIKRLGIPAYNWWNECLHGVARAGKATVFPQAITMASSFDEKMLERIAQCISTEGRAIYNKAVKQKGFSTRYQGLTFWTPNINIFRDPRWGRGQETYGEDPYLTERMGTAMVKGLQQEEKGYMKAAACAKHFAVHSGPEADRHGFDAQVSPKDLWETYLPAFRTLVNEGVESVMGAYNRTLGEPCCGSQLLLVDILREQWGFRGHVVSDCWAIRDFHKHHKVTRGPEESVSLALEKGCDLNCGCTYEYILKALEQGLIEEHHLDTSLKRLLETRFKLGLMDPPEQVPWSGVDSSVLDSPDHRKLSLEAAEKGMVLLKNKGILPLKKEAGLLYVTGPNALDPAALLGNYYGMSSQIITALEGVVEAAGDSWKIDYRPGCLLDHPKANPVNWAEFEAAESDVTLAIMGLHPQLEGEEGDALSSPDKGDRSGIEIPQNQLDFLKKLRENAKKLVVCLFGGSPISMNGFEEECDALLYLGIPGAEGGRALGRILFGEVNPSGKLPMTFPRSTDQLPPYSDYNMEGRTYRFMKEDPLFPFGYGLSYSRFEYGELKISATEISPGEELQCSIFVTNTGEWEGEEVAQLYIRDLEGSSRVPLSSLCGFQRVSLKPGEKHKLNFTVKPEQMALVDDSGKSLVEPGEFLLLCGGVSPGNRGQELGCPALKEVRFSVG